MTPPRPKPLGPLVHAVLVLFTVAAIPLLIALPFLLSGFLGRD